jgi:hypothetical protein
MHAIAALAALAAVSLPITASAREPFPGADASSPIATNGLGWIALRYERSPAARARWAQIIAEAEARRAAEAARVRSDPLVRGSALPQGKADCYADLACTFVLRANRAALLFPTWQSFLAAQQEAAPFLAGYSQAARAAIENAEAMYVGPSLDAEIGRRSVGEQVWRLARGSDGRHVLPLSAGARQIFDLLAGQEIRKIDIGNARWLRERLQAGAWPAAGSLSGVSEKALWRMVRHADADPGLQLLALRRIEEASSRGQFPRSQVPERIDAIAVEQTGTQIFGTQLECKDGVWTPVAIRNPAEADRLRIDYGIGTMAEQRRALPDHC